MRKPSTILIGTLLASLTLTACGGGSSYSSGSSPSTSSGAAAPASSATAAQEPTVKSTHNSALGTTILVDSRGMTLYHLSGEQAGRFICSSSACTAIWHPLTTSVGAAPTGAASLATVKRPDGTEQVTYKGTPLYTFAQDTSPGDAKGQNLKDVGTWSAVSITSTSSSAPASPPTTTTRSSGGAYGY